MRKGFTTQKKIYDYIVSYIKENNYPPTFREIGDAVGLKSINSVYNHIHNLVERGVITLEEYKPRTIKVLRELVE